MITIPSISRFKAASIHLAISAAIALAVMAVMLTLWYPPPLFQGMGGMLLVVLIVGVDVTIGPLITLIVFNPKKKELVFDLAVIATLQVAALVYGTYAMSVGRPVFVAFVENRFEVVSAADLEADAIKQARPEFRTLSLTGPTLVAVDLPTDNRERQDIMLANIGGLGAQHMPKYYVPYAERSKAVLDKAYALETLRNLTADEQAELQSAIKRSGRPNSGLRFLPLVTPHGTMTALIDAENGELLSMLSVDPARRESVR